MDSNDEVIGLRDKVSCHEGRGILHRAISAFVFNEEGELLIQQRHTEKALWGGFWSNSCCTHPFYKEDSVVAAQRRVREELGLSVDLEYVYKFEYRADWQENWCEHELCSVFVGHTEEQPIANETEVMDWRWISSHDLNHAIETKSLALTPWLLLEWEELNKRGIPS